MSQAPKHRRLMPSSSNLHTGPCLQADLPGSTRSKIRVGATDSYPSARLCRTMQMQMQFSSNRAA